MEKKTLLALILSGLLVALFLVWLLIPGRLTIEVAQTGGHTTINQAQHPTPYEAKLRWGKHRIIVGAPGYEPEEHLVRATPGVKKAYRFSLIVPSDQAGEALDEIQTKNSWTAELPRSNDHYEIVYSPNNKTFTITVFAIFNRPDQIESYKKELTTYGNEALAWIRGQGGDPNALPIEWLPEKPTGLKWLDQPER